MLTCLQGRFVSADGAFEYDGEWRDDLKHGNGVMRNSAIGVQYKGSWAEDFMEVSVMPSGARKCAPLEWLREPKIKASLLSQIPLFLPLKSARLDSSRRRSLLPRPR